MGEYAVRMTMAVIIAAAGVYSAWVHMKAGLDAPETPPLSRRILPGLFYLCAALFLCNLAFAPGRMAAFWLPAGALQRARELSIPEKSMTVVLSVCAAAVLAWDAALAVIRKGNAADG